MTDTTDKAREEFIKEAFAYCEAEAAGWDDSASFWKEGSEEAISDRENAVYIRAIIRLAKRNESDLKAAWDNVRVQEKERQHLQSTIESQKREIEKMTKDRSECARINKHACKFYD